MIMMSKIFYTLQFSSSDLIYWYLFLGNYCIKTLYLLLQTMGNLGSSDVDSRLEEQLIDGILYAFQEQTQEVTGSLFGGPAPW